MMLTPAKINVDSKASPFLTFFLITSMQTGVGILGFARYIAQFAGYDAWIAIIFCGLSTNITLWFIYKIIERGSGNDIISIHSELFGNWLGGLLNAGVLAYFLVGPITTLRSYIEAIQIWVFPQISTWELALLILLLAYVFIVGGFRTATGICVLSVVYSTLFFVILYYPLKYAHFNNLLPLFDHSLPSLFQASKQMVFSFGGFELIFIYYPFIKKPHLSKKWAHTALMFTTFFYVIVALVIFVFFSEGQLSHILWSTLTLWAIVKLPIIERFEYFGLAVLLLVILANICISIWSVTRGLKRQFFIRQKIFLPFVLIIVLIITCLSKEHIPIDQWNSFVSKIIMYFLYIYIPVLFIYQWLFLKVKRMKKNK
ncbi:GerAB/ArcD/ProY family transporter [Scopulibacillus cellulosilyticus]|uniref:GerAB/ArcD/ProY family transporter n=1 Tax=Scopulibacillus cellulosilyticus TaxID=2665665 RepID=A0ABW2Q1L1_9BACL